jgi:TMEM175 potassium channel family protein
MNTTYNRIAGQSIERLAALSDGIFGVAMTLLLLQLNVPDPHIITTESALLHALARMTPDLLVYLMSFITLGIFWVGQQAQFAYLKRSDRHLTWINLAFLFAVTILPFSTRLLASFITHRSALIVYWANICLLGLFLYACWIYSNRARLIKDDVSGEVQPIICRRILFAQSLYAFGAALCIFSTYLSIGFIVLVQLNYAFAPGYGRAK